MPSSPLPFPSLLALLRSLSLLLLDQPHPSAHTVLPHHAPPYFSLCFSGRPNRLVNGTFATKWVHIVLLLCFLGFFFFNFIQTYPHHISYISARGRVRVYNFELLNIVHTVVHDFKCCHEINFFFSLLLYYHLCTFWQNANKHIPH